MLYISSADAQAPYCRETAFSDPEALAIYGRVVHAHLLVILVSTLSSYFQALTLLLLLLLGLSLFGRCFSCYFAPWFDT
jgi:hypothetical protein